MFLQSCARTQKETTIHLISPLENYTLGKAESYLVDNTDKPDKIDKVTAISYFETQCVVASESGIYIIDIKTRKAKKYYKFRFNTQDSAGKTVVQWSSLIPNSDNSKLLITTSSGQSSTAVLFQIDLTSLKIDWLSEYKYPIVASRYSHNNNQIALGTIYHQKETSGDSAVYHASLFLVNSNDGSFKNYFQQGESVEAIKFNHNDEVLFAVLGWPHVDTYVWDVHNTKSTKGVYGKDYTAYYDATPIDNNTFVTIGADGIYKWNINDPDNYALLAGFYINSSGRIYEVKELTQKIVLNYTEGTINPPSIQFYNKQWKVTDSLSFDSPMNHLTYNGITITGICESDTVVVFTVAEKKITTKIHKSELLR